jgi:hypothetical protein
MSKIEAGQAKRFEKQAFCHSFTPKRMLNIIFTKKEKYKVR